MDHPTVLIFMLVVHNPLQLSGSVATPPAAASLSSAASRRACEGARYTKDRSFTSGVSNPHQRICDERQGPVTFTLCAFTILSKKKGNRQKQEALYILPSERG